MKSELFIEAGLWPGDRALWTLGACPGFCPAQTHEVVVVGIHTSDRGGNAIEVLQANGQGFRAYPKELQPLKAAQ